MTELDSAQLRIYPSSKVVDDLKAEIREALAGITFHVDAADGGSVSVKVVDPAVAHLQLNDPAFKVDQRVAQGCDDDTQGNRVVLGRVGPELIDEGPRNDEPVRNVHDDSSTRRQLVPALRITVEVPRRGGADSHPCVCGGRCTGPSGQAARS